MHAGWNTVTKQSRDPLITLWLVILTGGFVGCLLTPFVSFPAPAAHPYLAASLVFHLVYYLCLTAAYRAGPLSLVYPIARGIGPCVVGIGGYLLAGEHLRPIQVAGLAAASIGIISLARSGRTVDSGMRAILAACATGVVIGCYTFVDGQGVRHVKDPFDYIVWAFVLDALPLTVATLVLRRKEIRSALRGKVSHGIAGGLMATLAYTIVLWAMSQTVMASVAALRETSVVFAAVIGAVKLKESFGMRRVLSAAAVAGGLVILHL